MTDTCRDEDTDTKIDTNKETEILSMNYGLGPHMAYEC